MTTLTDEAERIRALMCERGVADASDDQLRAECERRGIETDIAFTYNCHGCGYDSRDYDTASERDREEEAHDASCRFGVRAVTAERDEWKRRAEAAEAKVESMPVYEIYRTVDRLPVTVARNEEGPGIAAQRPDNSVAHLDEDLLCDDAD